MYPSIVRLGHLWWERMHTSKLTVMRLLNLRHSRKVQCTDPEYNEVNCCTCSITTTHEFVGYYGPTGPYIRIWNSTSDLFQSFMLYLLLNCTVDLLT